MTYISFYDIYIQPISTAGESLNAQKSKGKKGIKALESALEEARIEQSTVDSTIETTLSYIKRHAFQINYGEVSGGSFYYL